jgi:hypothetical protein
MTVISPEWLTRRGGALRPGIDGHTWIVEFDQRPQYWLTPMPAKGKYACQVMQGVNGRRVESSRIYPSAEEAVQGGLEELRTSLGW